MRVSVSFTAIFVVVLALLVGGVASQVAAQSATPVAEDILDALAGPDEFCTEQELDLGAEGARGVDLEPDILRGPPGHEAFGAEVPWQAIGDYGLALNVTTLQEGACLGYHAHDGAYITYVQSGAIEFAIAPVAGETGATAYHGKEQAEPVDIPLETFVTIAAGEWIGQKGELWHTFRNTGGVPATVIVAASYGPLTVAEAVSAVTYSACRGGCSGRGRVP